MRLQDSDSWMPVALVAAGILIAIPACLPKDSGGDDNRRGGTGWYDSGWDSYSDDHELDDESDGAATTVIEDADLALTWNMTNDIPNPSNWDPNCR